MLSYHLKLKLNSRKLRNNMTDAERRLWYHLRQKQVCNIQFYRQKPIGNYIVGFYAPKVRLVVEVDGGQHFEKKGLLCDKRRDAFLSSLNLKILRFDNRQVLLHIKQVMEVIFFEVSKRK